MARLARVIVADVPYHITQRGNARRFVLDSDRDRAVYLELLQQNAATHRLSLLGWVPQTSRFCSSGRRKE